MNFKPLGSRVLVKRADIIEKTTGGLIIPEAAKEKPSEGEVLAVGPGSYTEAGVLMHMNVSVGDKILFGKWSGTEISVDGQDAIIMQETDILGIIG
jgi:chaperonin GroES